MKVTDLWTVAIALFLGAGSSAGQQALHSGMFEVLGLDEWTVEMLADSVAKYAPGVSLEDAACAVILRDSVGFAQAAVERMQLGPEESWTTLTVVEPSDAERVSIRSYPDSLPDRPSWRAAIAIMQEHPPAISPLQDYGVLTGRSSEFFGEPVDDASIALRNTIIEIARSEGDSAALWTLAHDRNRENRIVAALVLGQFAERESSWLALMSALRGPSSWETTMANMTLSAMARGASRTVDWGAIEEDLRFLMGGTNLFAWMSVLTTLSHTNVSLETARALLIPGHQLLADNLTSINPRRRAVVRRFLARASVLDYGSDDIRWESWLKAQVDAAVAPSR